LSSPVVLEDVYYTFEDDKNGEESETRVKRERRPEARGVIDPVEFARKRLRFEPDERQIEVLRSDAKRGILNCTRQWGKSTIAAAKAVHRAYTREKSLVLVASPTDRQSAEFIRKAREMVGKLGIRPRGDGDNQTSLLFPNGSRIVGLPGMEGTVRGFSAVSLLLIDEAARVDDAMYKALRPMLAVGQGDLWLMSTPYGKRGFFYECWEHEPRDEWFRVTVPATECARISGEFLEEERRAIGPQWFAQEYMAEFVDNGTAVFGRDLVEAAVDDGFGVLDL
jgi:Terminase large subunit, T4likevirus-type, N-terminal